ncbi:DsrE family protein [bacterium]|nr:DsrE family protein [bacterium]
MNEENSCSPPILTPPKLSFVEKNLHYYLDIINDCLPKEDLQTVLFDDSKIDCALIFSHKYIGSPDELGYELLKLFITEAHSLERIPHYVVFIHEAAELCADSSELLPQLQKLKDRGCSIRVCEHSARHFELQDKIHIAALASAAEILNICLNSKKAIRF